MTAAAAPQPAPVECAKPVLPAVLSHLNTLSSLVDAAIERDLIARAQVGRMKYGTVLKTHNGRDALIDLYQEGLDAVMYSAQYLLELDANSDYDEWRVRWNIFYRALEFARLIARRVADRDKR